MKFNSKQKCEMDGFKMLETHSDKFHFLYHCYTFDYIMTLVPIIFQEGFDNIHFGIHTKVDYEDNIAERCWFIEYFHMYSRILYPSFLNCLSNVHNQISTSIA